MVTNLQKSSITESVITKTQIYDFLLLENGSYILLETGDKIILEDSVLHPVPPINLSKNSSTISMITKS